MKEIQTNKYIKKEAIFSRRDHGLPGDMSERDIPGGIEPNEVHNQVGESEIDITLSYTYSYNYNNNGVKNIVVTSISDSLTGERVPFDELEGFFEDKIREDVSGTELNTDIGPDLI